MTEHLTLEHLTLEQMREFLDAGVFSILDDKDSGYWIRIKRERVPEAFAAGLAPFSTLQRYLGHDPVYTLPRGTVFVPLIR